MMMDLDVIFQVRSYFSVFVESEPFSIQLIFYTFRI